MSKGRKRGGGKKRGPSIGAERLESLRDRLEELVPEDLSEAEFEALVEAVSHDEAENALAGMPLLDRLTGANKRRTKALRRGVHRLRQRGLSTEDLSVGRDREGIRVRPDHGAGGGLPVLMAPIEINALRRMTFGLARGPGVVVVEVAFKARELFRLAAGPSNRVAYRRWARQLCTAEGEELPERVSHPPEWLQRKLWEIGRCAKDESVGREVDETLLAHLEWPSTAPPHPATSLELAGSELLTVEALAERPHRLDGFYHGSALAALRSQWYELGGQSDIDPGSSAGLERREDMQGPVRDWAEQWGLDRIAETLLDAALFFDAVGDHDSARTFLEVGKSRDGEQVTTRDNRIRRFLLDVVMWQLRQ